MNAILREPVSPYFLRSAEAAVYLDAVETVRTNDSASAGFSGNPSEWEDSLIATLDLVKAIEALCASKAPPKRSLSNAERCKAYYERKGRARYLAKTRKAGTI